LITFLDSGLISLSLRLALFEKYITKASYTGISNLQIFSTRRTALSRFQTLACPIILTFCVDNKQAKRTCRPKMATSSDSPTNMISRKQLALQHSSPLSCVSVIWALPAVGVHLVANCLHTRFLLPQTSHPTVDLRFTPPIPPAIHCDLARLSLGGRDLLSPKPLTYGLWGSLCTVFCSLKFPSTLPASSTCSQSFLRRIFRYPVPWERTLSRREGVLAISRDSVQGSAKKLAKLSIFL